MLSNIVDVKTSCVTHNGSIQKLSLWEYLIDTPLDGFKKSDNIAQSKFEDFSYSARLPHTFKGTLTCFGDELKLPNLQKYLLDSHYKQAAKMIAKVRYFCKDDKKVREISYQEIYNCCMALITTAGVTSDVNFLDNLFFLPTQEEIENDPKYENFSDIDPSGIKRKKDGQEKEPYKSMEDYILREIVKLEAKYPQVPSTKAKPEEGRSLLSRIFHRSDKSQ